MKYDKEFESFRQEAFKQNARIQDMPIDTPVDPEMVETFNDIFRQPFQNVMLQTEDKIQADVTSELKTILKMIPKVADPENENTKKIMGTIEELIAESDEDIDYVDDISELGVSDEDLEDDPEEK